MKYETINDAAHAWVAEFNAIPMAIIDKLLEQNSDELHEITPPSVGDRVFVFDSPADEDTGEIIGHNENIYTIKLDDGTTCDLEAGDFEVQHDEFLPMWGTMWAFGDSIDNWWLEDGGFKLWQTVASVSMSRKIMITYSALTGLGTAFMTSIGSRSIKRVV